MSIQPVLHSRWNPLTLSSGSWLTHHTSGSAKVSNGTMRVAMTAVRTSFRPGHCIRDRAKAAMLLTTMPSTTVIEEISTEFNRNRAAGTRSNTAM
ncbi:hypothetical protein SHIRM173S_07318 [Streptomyces hirsutus]